MKIAPSILAADFANLAADVARRFNGLDDHPRRDAILQAALEHDNGWHEPDAALLFDEASGRALDFIGAPDTVKQSVWPIAIDRVATGSSYAAALIGIVASVAFIANRQDGWPWRLSPEARQVADLQRFGFWPCTRSAQSACAFAR